MKSIKYLLLSLLVLLFAADIVGAAQVKVMYFFYEKNANSQAAFPLKEDIKIFWQGIEWKEYDYFKDSDVSMFEKYQVWSMPTAVVACGDKEEKVEGLDNFSARLNESIAKCEGFVTTTTAVSACEGWDCYPENIISVIAFFIILIFAIIFFFIRKGFKLLSGLLLR